jgi:hypothetical protein
METTRTRRWWQFGLRDVLWLVVVAAVAVGWWTRERGFERERSHMQGELTRLTEWTDTYKQMGRETGGFHSHTCSTGRTWFVGIDGSARSEQSIESLIREYSRSRAGK